jgi:hypothetical protein
MPYTHNPIGALVIQESPATFDREALLRHLEATRPYTYGFLQDAGLMAEALRRVPELKVAGLRTYRQDEEKQFWKYGQAKITELLDAHLAAQAYLGFDLERGYLYVGNEDDWSTVDILKKSLAWYVDLMRAARAVGVHCIVANFGVAKAPQAWIDAGYFDVLLAEFEDGFHALGAHEYYGAVGPAGCAGRYASMHVNKEEAQPKWWASPYDVQIGSMAGNWLVGRIFWWFDRCDTLHMRRPRTIITETGSDRLDDLEHVRLSEDSLPVNVYQILENAHKRWSDERQHYDIVPWPHVGMRGWDTLQWVWEDYYGDTQGWSWQRAAFEFQKWQLFIYDDTYPEVNAAGRKTPTIEGIWQYAWCPDTFWDTSDGFDISRLTEYHALVKDYADAIYATQQPDEPPPDEPPDDGGPGPDPAPLVDWQVGFLAVLMMLVVSNAIWLVIVIQLTHVNASFNQGVQYMDIISLPEAGNILGIAIATILAGGLSATVTTPLVNLLKLLDAWRVKYLPALGKNTVSGNIVSLFVAALVTVIVWISQWAGVSVQVNNVFDLIASILPPVLLFLATLTGQKALFTQAAKHDLPVFGYQRTNPAQAADKGAVPF